jgi:hypothetical protein
MLYDDLIIGTLQDLGKILGQLAAGDLVCGLALLRRGR